MRLPKVSDISFRSLEILLPIIHWAAFGWITIIFFQAKGGIEVSWGEKIAYIVLMALGLLDLPATLLGALLLLPFLLVGSLEWYFILVGLFSLFTVTFQWYLVGKKIRNFLWHEESEFKGIDLKDIS